MKKIKRKATQFVLMSSGTFVLLWAAGCKGLLPEKIKTTPGSLAITAAIITATSLLFVKHWKKTRYLRSPLKKIDKMSGEQFELWLKYWFEKKGYRAKLTDTTGDFGADLVLSGHGERIVVQAKRYKKSVGIEAVQQVIGAKGHYRADRCIVATNSRFTAAAKTLAKDNDVELMDREYFFEIRGRKNR